MILGFPEDIPRQSLWSNNSIVVSSSNNRWLDFRLLALYVRIFWNVNGVNELEIQFWNQGPSKSGWSLSKSMSISYRIYCSFIKLAQILMVRNRLKSVAQVTVKNDSGFKWMNYHGGKKKWGHDPQRCTELLYITDLLQTDNIYQIKSISIINQWVIE